jgi:hypothetical protein
MTTSNEVEYTSCKQQLLNTHDVIALKHGRVVKFHSIPTNYKIKSINKSYTGALTYVEANLLSMDRNSRGGGGGGVGTSP